MSSSSHVSFNSPSTVMAETVYFFLTGALYGGAFGLVTPFHAPGSAAALEEVRTGVFRPAMPFRSLRSVPAHAIACGSLLAVHRFGSKSAEFARGKQDGFNILVGCAVAGPYYWHFLVKRAVGHNRAVGAIVLGSIAYANFL